jgi:hypothetical protein
MAGALDFGQLLAVNPSTYNSYDYGHEPVTGPNPTWGNGGGGQGFLTAGNQQPARTVSDMFGSSGPPSSIFGAGGGNANSGGGNGQWQQLISFLMQHLGMGNQMGSQFGGGNAGGGALSPGNLSGIYGKW